MNRREFIAASAAATVASAASPRLPIQKALYFSMLPAKLSFMDRFKMARDCGFDGIELPTMEDQKQAEEAKKAAEATKVRIHSVMNQAHWDNPLSSSDPAVVAKSMKGMETSLRNAKFWGAETVLLVPAVVNPKTSYYKDAWTRSQTQIRKLIPLAAELKVIIGIEEVWNKFLLSPIEFATYVDEFKSPWAKAYLDVGNMVFYGYPQDWIRTLGKRTVKLHFKDFRWSWKTMKTEFVNLREGDIDWKEVYKALTETGYKGWATAELDSGDAKYLADVAKRMDLILTGA